MDYLKYVMIIGLASLSVAAVCCAALWLMAPLILARAGRAPEPETEPPAPALPPGEAGSGVVFDFSAAQAPELAKLLLKESPEDIAIVLSRLRGDAGRALLAALAPELRAQVLFSLAAPRSVEQELILGMKAELENRLYGVVGGAAAAAAFIRDLPYKERKSTLEKIYSQDPARGAGLRALFILDDDLAAMPEKDLRALAGAVPPEVMGGFLSALPDKFKTKIKEQYQEKAALALERAAAGGQGQKEKEAALSAFMERVEKLVAKGIIAKPAPRLKAAAPAATNSWG